MGALVDPVAHAPRSGMTLLLALVSACLPFSVSGVGEGRHSPGQITKVEISDESSASGPPAEPSDPLGDFFRHDGDDVPTPVAEDDPSGWYFAVGGLQRAARPCTFPLDQDTAAFAESAVATQWCKDTSCSQGSSCLFNHDMTDSVRWRDVVEQPLDTRASCTAPKQVPQPCRNRPENRPGSHRLQRVWVNGRIHNVIDLDENQFQSYFHCSRTNHERRERELRLKRKIDHLKGQLAHFERSELGPKERHRRPDKDGDSSPPTKTVIRARGGVCVPRTA